jgi:hypothetical protein
MPFRNPSCKGFLSFFLHLTAYTKRQRLNRLYVPKYEELERQCTDLFIKGLIRVSNSPYIAPTFMVLKLDGSIRVFMCRLKSTNECIVKDSFPLPRIDDLLNKLRNSKCMSHLDLLLVYNQVRIPDDGPQDDYIVATALSFQGLTPHWASCLMAMLVMGFCLCNALVVFSRLMNHVLEPYL